MVTLLCIRTPLISKYHLFELGKSIGSTSLLSHTTNMILTNPAYPPFPRNEQQGIFFYGILLTDSLLSWLVTGSSPNYSAILCLQQPAILKTYRRVPVKHNVKENWWFRRGQLSPWVRAGLSDNAILLLLLMSTFGRTRWEVGGERGVEFLVLWKLQDWLDLFDGMEMFGWGYLFHHCMYPLSPVTHPTIIAELSSPL